MTVFNVSTTTRAVRVVAAGDGPCLIINRDHTNAVLIGNDPDVGTAANIAITIVDPLGTIAVNGNIDVYAVALTGTAQINVQADASSWSPSLAEIVTPLFVDIGASLASGTTVSSPSFDVRGFQGYYGRIAPTVTSGPTVQNSVKVVVSWGTDSTMSQLLFQDVYEFWSPQSAGGTGVSFDGSPLRIQDIMHGPFMQVDIVSLGGDNQNVDFNFYGTTRAFTSPFARQGSSATNLGSDGWLVYKQAQAIANGATVNIPAYFGYGRTSLKYAVGAGGLTINELVGFELRTLDADAVPANGTIRREEILPKRAPLFQVVNASGVASIYTIKVVSQFDRS